MRHRRLICVLTAILLLSGAATAPAATAAKTETQYLALFIGGKKSGYGKHIRRVADGKVTTSETMVITMSRGGATMTVRQVERYVETTDGKPLAFKAVQDMGIMASTIDGVIDSNGKINVTVTTGQSVQKRTMDWPEGAMMSEALQILSRKKGLTEGTTYTASVFSASLLKAMDAEVRVGPTGNVNLLGRVVSLTEVTTVLKGPTGAVTSTSYVDKNLEVQKSVIPMLGMKMELVACSRQFALSENDVADFLDRFLLSPPEPLTGVASAEEITYTLEPTSQPAGKAKLQFPTTDNQTVRKGENGVFIVTVRPVRPAAGAIYPYKGQDKVAVSALKATQYIQCDDKKIKVLARQAVGDTKDAAQAVRRIEKFVRNYIKKKDLSIGYASAVEVAASRQGDCTEHAVLSAALCRAVGIPAQIVTGIAYVESFGGREGIFGPHAWNRVLVGEKWVGLDAAFGVYDAGHIALAFGDGNPDEFFGIISTLGYFRIAKVATQK
ncbi:MAG: transglutaminase-like domain-containing protein [Planctomycetota bacterium]|nr:transglutaminase-like domain-containing protein [Planctomycetota bacterium]